jgi:hypothetical protein
LPPYLTIFPKSVHLLVVVIPLARFADYFLHVNNVNMAKYNKSYSNH